MSRSFKKSPFVGIAASSDKESKRKANLNCRRQQKQAIRSEAEIIPVLREVSNVWDMAKDGKIRVEKDSKWLRK